MKSIFLFLVFVTFSSGSYAGWGEYEKVRCPNVAKKVTIYRFAKKHYKTFDISKEESKSSIKISSSDGSGGVVKCYYGDSNNPSKGYTKIKSKKYPRCYHLYKGEKSDHVYKCGEYD